jgi:hypothetical protein
LIQKIMSMELSAQSVRVGESDSLPMILHHQREISHVRF